MRPLHTKATRRRRCSMTSEKAAVDASRLRKPQFLHARIALRGEEGGYCFSSKTRAFIVPYWRNRAPLQPANGRSIRD